MSEHEDLEWLDHVLPDEPASPEEAEEYLHHAREIVANGTDLAQMIWARKVIRLAALVLTAALLLTGCPSLDTADDDTADDDDHAPLAACTFEQRVHLAAPMCGDVYSLDPPLHISGAVIAAEDLAGWYSPAVYVRDDCADVGPVDVLEQPAAVYVVAGEVGIVRDGAGGTVVQWVRVLDSACGG